MISHFGFRGSPPFRLEKSEWMVHGVGTKTSGRGLGSSFGFGRRDLAVLFFCVYGARCQQPADLLAEQRAVLAEGKLAKTEASLHSYLAGHPSSAEAHSLLGYVLCREQKPVESLAEFT